MESQIVRPTVIVIFGAGGDLTKRKIIPALYNLYIDKRLPEKFTIIGFSKTEFSDDDFRKLLMDNTNEFSRSGNVKAEDWEKFASRVFYETADIMEVNSYNVLANKISNIKSEWNEQICTLYYCAVPPSLFCPIADNI